MTAVAYWGHYTTTRYSRALNYSWFSEAADIAQTRWPTSTIPVTIYSVSLQRKDLDLKRMMKCTVFLAGIVDISISLPTEL